jgi:hypothetical protein
MQHHHAALKTALESTLEASTHQRWHYDAKTGLITGFDGRVLDVEGGSKAKAAKVLYYDKKPADNLNQQWDYKDGYFVTRMGTGFVIDVNGGSMTNGTALILWDPNGQNNQKWDIDEWGYIRSRGSNAMVIDVNGGPKPGKGATPVSLWQGAITRDQATILAKFRNCQHQRWHYDAKSGFITGYDGRVLDIEGGSKAQGAKVIVWDRKPNDNANQQWDYKDGQFVTRSGTGFVIDISGGHVADGGEIIVWPPNNAAWQKWDLDAYGFIRSRANPKICLDINGGAKPGKPSTKISAWTAYV